MSSRFNSSINGRSWNYDILYGGPSQGGGGRTADGADDWDYYYYDDDNEKDDLLSGETNTTLTDQEALSNRYTQYVSLVITIATVVLLLVVIYKLYKAQHSSVRRHLSHYTCCLLASLVAVLAETCKVLYILIDCPLSRQKVLYYLESITSIMVQWMGICLLQLCADLLYCAHVPLKMKQLSLLQKLMWIASVFILILLAIVNNLPSFLLEDFPPEAYGACRRGNIYNVFGKLDAEIKSGITITIIVIGAMLMLAIVYVLKRKWKRNVGRSSPVNIETDRHESLMLADWSPGDEGSSRSRRSGSRKSKSEDMDRLTVSPKLKMCKITKKRLSNPSGKDNVSCNSDTTTETNYQGSVENSPSHNKNTKKRNSQKYSRKQSVKSTGSPKLERRQSKAYLEDQAMMFALENFFVCDPTEFVTNAKQDEVTQEQGATLIDEEMEESDFTEPSSNVTVTVDKATNTDHELDAELKAKMKAIGMEALPMSEVLLEESLAAFGQDVQLKNVKSMPACKGSKESDVSGEKDDVDDVVREEETDSTAHEKIDNIFTEGAIDKTKTECVEVIVEVYNQGQKEKLQKHNSLGIKGETEINDEIVEHLNEHDQNASTSIESTKDKAANPIKSPSEYISTQSGIEPVSLQTDATDTSHKSADNAEGKNQSTEETGDHDIPVIAISKLSPEVNNKPQPYLQVYRQLLVNSFKDLSWFVFMYLVCQIPQLVHNLFLVMCGQDGTGSSTGSGTGSSAGNCGISSQVLMNLSYLQMASILILLFLIPTMLAWRLKVFSKTHARKTTVVYDI